MSKRQKIGYIVTLISLTMLISGYLIYPFINHRSLSQIFVGITLVAMPLLYFSPRAYQKDLKTYQILALAAPIYFFLGGIIWLWNSPWWGLWFCLGAVGLEIGTILHNFRKKHRPKKKI